MWTLPAFYFQRVKRPGCEDDQSPSSSGEQYIFMAYSLIKQKESITVSLHRAFWKGRRWWELLRYVWGRRQDSATLLCKRRDCISPLRKSWSYRYLHWFSNPESFIIEAPLLLDKEPAATGEWSRSWKHHPDLLESTLRRFSSRGSVVGTTRGIILIKHYGNSQVSHSSGLLIMLEWLELNTRPFRIGINELWVQILSLRIISTCIFKTGMSSGSAVGIATGYCLDNLGGQECSVLHVVQTCSGVHPASYPVGTWLERRRREADHSPTTGAEVKKTWIDTVTPPYVFMA
jgi:hypothetical protein